MLLVLLTLHDRQLDLHPRLHRVQGLPLMQARLSLQIVARPLLLDMPYYSPYVLIESTKLTQQSNASAVPACAFNTSLLCNTSFEPPCITSIDELAGTLTPFIKYLVVDPPSDTNTSNVAVVVRMLAKRKPTTASSLLAVSIVVGELVILAPFD